MATLETRAFVLRAVDFGESDRIAHLLTPATSRLTVIAKGAKRSKRRFPGTLDLFNLLDVRVEQRRANTMGRLEQAKLLDAFDLLRTRPARFALACYIAELVDRLAPEGAGGADASELYEVVLGAIRVVASREPDARLRALLELRVLAALGLRPELRRCVRCGRDIDVAALTAPSAAVPFHVAEGGPLCRSCTTGPEGVVAVHLGTLRALEQGLRLPIDRLDRLALGAQPIAEAQALLSRFLRFHVGFEVRSERFLDSVLASGAARASA
ncbi:MAG: DNA repair protein RecO [Proteobacteria bacterium]|nr:DNA repair protein RecO [Pseudomonadota bacterium]